MRLDIIHELLEGEFAVKLYQSAESFEIEIKQNTVSYFPPPLDIIFTAVRAYV